MLSRHNRAIGSFVLAVSLALTGCARHTGSPAPGTSPQAGVAARPSGPTPIPVHVETKSNGSRYVTMVQQVPVPGGASRIAYEVRALSSQGDFGGTADASAIFDQPHITFHDRNGKTLIADAPKATVTQRDKSVLMTGGVHARSQEGSTLTCDRLRYDGRTEQLHGDGHVVLTGPNGFSMHGDRLDGNVRLDNIRVSRYGT